MPSRGLTLKELKDSQVWFYGPSWLGEKSLVSMQMQDDLPPECLEVLRVKEKEALVLSVIESKGSIGDIMDIERFSSLEKLLNTTAYILLFLEILKGRVRTTSTSSGSLEKTDRDGLVGRAETLWIKEVQMGCITEAWKTQFTLFRDGAGVWRCDGRLGKSDLPYHTRHPVLLPKNHYFSLLMVRRAHQRVAHSGVKDTLVEVRSSYWIPQGRAFVRQYIYHCVTCRRYAASSYKPPPPPPLPEFRVQQSILLVWTMQVHWWLNIIHTHHARTGDGIHTHHAMRKCGFVCLPVVLHVQFILM